MLAAHDLDQACREGIYLGVCGGVKTLRDIMLKYKKNQGKKVSYKCSNFAYLIMITKHYSNLKLTQVPNLNLIPLITQLGISGWKQQMISSLFM